jgi:carboxypeptidase C (cathepsin A)
MLKLAVACCLALSAPVLAQPDKQPDKKPKTAETSSESDKKDKAPSVTHHEVTIGGKVIKYTATAGCLDLPDYEGKPKANVFYIAYTKDIDDAAAPPAAAPGPAPAPKEGESKDSQAKPAEAKPPPPKSPGPARPITFAFNGGPGSSSVWLHLGALGPRRVKYADPSEKPGEPALPMPPYSVVENEFSWLDLTDLVFIDPVSTGYSRPVEGENANQFHGLNEDIRWVGDFIRLWTTKNRRWDSPKFLAGESYGTTRAAGLSGYLQDTHGMYLSGIVLISPVLYFQTIEFDSGNETPYWLYLPTYTATAWYHRRLDAELQRDLPRTLDEVRRWASTDYVVALSKGDALSDRERDEVAARLSRYTGLSKRFVLDSRLRILDDNFYKELLRDQDRIVGRLDSRYKGIDRRGITATPDYDPSYSAIQGPFTAALNAYVREELGYENDNPYEILTGRVHPWSYASATNRYAEVANTLRSAMTKNPALHVLVASGYYDLATPFFAATYTIDHLGLDPTLRSHITQAFYECGHMMYIRHADLAKLKSDVAALFARALAGTPAAAGAK